MYGVYSAPSLSLFVNLFLDRVVVPLRGLSVDQIDQFKNGFVCFVFGNQSKRRKRELK